MTTQPVAARVTTMTALPMSSSGLRPQRSTTKTTQAVKTSLVTPRTMADSSAVLAVKPSEISMVGKYALIALTPLNCWPMASSRATKSIGRTHFRPRSRIR